LEARRSRDDSERGDERRVDRVLGFAALKRHRRPGGGGGRGPEKYFLNDRYVHRRAVAHGASFTEPAEYTRWPVGGQHYREAGGRSSDRDSRLPIADDLAHP